MNSENLKNIAKTRLPQYLAQRGIQYKKNFHCLNPEHPDKHPSMSFDKNRHKVHCFACQADYDIFDLVGLNYGLSDLREIFKKTYELLGLSNNEEPKAVFKKMSVKKDYSTYLIKTQNQLKQTNYPQTRGLSKKTCQKFSLGFDPDFKVGTNESWAALIIPTGQESFTARNIDPQADKNNRIRKRGPARIFNADILWAAERPVFVTEGELDALLVIEAGGLAVGLGSCANVGSFLKLVEAKTPVKPLLIALDNDDEGRRAQETLIKGLKSLSLPFYEINLAGVYKDPNEALTADQAALTAAVNQAETIENQLEETAKNIYLQKSAAFQLNDFKGQIAAKVDTPCLPTGFTKLDHYLGGGLYEGLYIIGAISSLGKTTFTLQLADQLAFSGQDILFFSLEMSAGELMAKSLSRHTLLTALNYGLSGSVAKTARGISSGGRYQHYSPQELKVIETAMADYEQYAYRVFISEGLGNVGVDSIRKEVELHFQVTGRKPVVVVDYLQIMAPANERSSDKQNIDKNVLELKRLSRDFKIPLLAISSFNRANYREAAAMESFKESGAIEYSSDVLLGLQLKGAGDKNFNALAEKEKNPRAVELVILKNRHGLAGKKVDCEYYPLFNYFKELNSGIQ